jgi:hypothetical protein
MKTGTTESNEVKTTTSKLSTYLLIFLSVLGGFTVGYYYNLINDLKMNQGSASVTEVKKVTINLAVDEFNNLLVIDKETGSYIVYEDSVGLSIFNLYARNIHTKHKNTDEKVN